MEVGVAIKTFDFFNLDLDLSPCGVMSLRVKFTERDVENTTTEGVSGNL
jgi:hypothetical protein